MQYKIERRRDLRAAGAVSEIWPHALLMQGDADAAIWRVKMTDGGAAVALDGYTIGAEVTRPSGVTVTIAGAVADGAAEVILSGPCFAEGGMIACRMTASGADGTQIMTLDYLRIPVIAHSIDRIVDTDDQLPSLPAFLAELSRLEAATDAAMALVDTPAYIGANGNWYTFDTQTLAYADSGVRAVGKDGANAASNYLDNSYFCAVVNQRGQASYSGVGQTIDRWKFNAGNATAAITSQGLAISTVSGASNFGLLQRLDPALDLRGHTLTIAAQDADGIVYSGVLTVPEGADDFATSLKEIEIAGGRICVNMLAAGDASPYVRIVADGGATVILRWIALYEGAYAQDALPAYIHRGVAAELAACRRYYQRIGARDAYSVFGAGVATTDTRIDFSIPIVPMRAGVVPTVSASGAFGLAGRLWVQSSGVPLAGASCTDSACSVYVEIADALLTIGEAYLLRAYDDADAYIALSADL